VAKTEINYSFTALLGAVILSVFISGSVIISTESIKLWGRSGGLAIAPGRDKNKNIFPQVRHNVTWVWNGSFIVM
jgi:hypothetical protein